MYAIDILVLRSRLLVVLVCDACCKLQIATQTAQRLIFAILCASSVQVGPFFPFDNGPNGTNTLLAPNWMTTAGLLVLADPDTPFLHVGLNAPIEGPHDGWIQRTWGTGVSEGRALGDGE